MTTLDLVLIGLVLVVFWRGRSGHRQRSSGNRNDDQVPEMQAGDQREDAGGDVLIVKSVIAGFICSFTSVVLLHVVLPTLSQSWPIVAGLGFILGFSMYKISN